MKTHLRLKFLVFFALFGAGLNYSVTSANAKPVYDYCIHDFRPPTYGQLYDEGKQSSINIRKNPNANSRLVYTGSTSTPVQVHRQASGNDGYCWFKVQFVSNQVTGWVRGDLVDVYLDDIPVGL
jgi:hypothetical protein